MLHIEPIYVTFYCDFLGENVSFQTRIYIWHFQQIHYYVALMVTVVSPSQVENLKDGAGWSCSLYVRAYRKRPLLCCSIFHFPLLITKPKVLIFFIMQIKLSSVLYWDEKQNSLYTFL